MVNEKENNTATASYNMRMEAFTGDNNWHSWKRQFECTALLSKWTEHDKARMLMTSLTGAAREFLSSTSQETFMDYNKSCLALQERFAENISSDVYRSQLNTRKRKTGESLSLFVSDLQRLTLLAFPEMGEEARDQHANFHFVQGLAPAMREHIRRANTKSIQESVLVARREEENRLLCSVDTPQVAVIDAPSPSPAMPAQVAAAATFRSVTQPEQLREWTQLAEQMTNLAKEVREVRRQLDRQSTPPRTSRSGRERNSEPYRRPRFRGRCFECNEYNHRAIDCPYRGPVAERRERASLQQARGNSEN